MIRVRVPLDLHAVAVSGAAAFACVTPLRVRDLLALAVREAIGTRAPHDKYARSMARTLAGLASGDFVVDVDGRMFSDGDAVVVCDAVAAVRFFVNGRARSGLNFNP